MEIPTTTYINLPSNFLGQVFGVAGYLFSNLTGILGLIIGLVIGIFVIYLIIDLIKGE